MTSDKKINITTDISAYAITWAEYGLWRMRTDLECFTGRPVRVLPPGRKASSKIQAWIGWGRKPSGERARARARRDGIDFLLLEDGFLRSFSTSARGAKALSVVMDEVGIHYDATAPSTLENMLNTADFSPEDLRQAEKLLTLLRTEGLSKYNDGLPFAPECLSKDDEEKVLVIDQTAGDASLVYGLVTERELRHMLEAALEENPGAQIYIKTHPDVLTGRKRGAIPHLEDERITWLTGNWHPYDILPRFETVYTATSLMGLDALILGKRVRCFGLPFYAGWGLTIDEQKCERRRRRRSLPELVAASHLHYARYLDPVSGNPADAFTVAQHIAQERRRLKFWASVPGREWSGRVHVFGFRLWKHAQTRPFFGKGAQVHFHRSSQNTGKLHITPHDRIAVWGIRDDIHLRQLSEKLGTPLVRVEDGFIRSIGLGSDFHPPISLVYDRRGIYFDPTEPSDLEHLLNTHVFTDAERQEGRALAEFIVRNRLTKYNLGNTGSGVSWPVTGNTEVLLVPGQVEDDASILRGCSDIRTNLSLLERARAEHPEAFIVYKPHPEILIGNRKGAVHLDAARRYCDHVETVADILSCIEAADVMHTMTSLSGFDALLRGKKVVCHGLPFYAGWGLTDDRMQIPRRGRKLLLEELVYASIILYPVYCINGNLTTAVGAIEFLSNKKKESSCKLRKGRKMRYLIWQLQSFIKRFR